MLKNINQLFKSSIALGDLFSHLFGVAVDAATFKPNKKPSIGGRILPAKLKQNRKAVVLANIMVWVLLILAIAVVVSLLS